MVPITGISDNQGNFTTPIARAIPAAGQLSASAELAGLLQRNEGSADHRYWTAYDYYMVEQEARRMRRAYVAAHVVIAWRWVKQQVFAKQARRLPAASET